jgi:hypothetical protein
MPPSNATAREKSIKAARMSRIGPKLADRRVKSAEPGGDSAFPLHSSTAGPASVEPEPIEISSQTAIWMAEILNHHGGRARRGAIRTTPNEDSRDDARTG